MSRLAKNHLYNYAMGERPTADLYPRFAEHSYASARLALQQRKAETDPTQYAILLDALALAEQVTRLAN